MFCLALVTLPATPPCACDLHINYTRSFPLHEQQLPSAMRTCTWILLLLVSVVKALEFPHGWELWTAQDDYDVVKYPLGGDGFANFSFSGRVKSTGRDYTIYIATLSKGLPDTFGFELPAGGIKIIIIMADENHF